MSLDIASRRLGPASLTQRFGPNTRCLDLTSRGEEPWVRFSPFFPHGDIPVPFSPGVHSASVEGIWQGLKVFESTDVDPTKFAVTRMKGLKRTTRTFGRVLGHRRGVAGGELLGYREARYAIYLPAYRCVLEHRLQDELERLRELAAGPDPVALLDYETNCDLDDLSRPLSHAGLVKRYLEGAWPTGPAAVRYRQGDATRPEGDGPRVIVHVCNDRGGWGKGFVLALSRRWPEPEAAYRAWHGGQGEEPFALGAVQLEPILTSTLVKRGVEVTVYDLDPAAASAPSVDGEGRP